MLFNWQPERWRDFYFRIADEAPVDTVISAKPSARSGRRCSSEHFEAVAERLEAAGKTVVLSTLAEVYLPADRKLVAESTSARTAAWSRSTMPRR